MEPILVKKHSGDLVDFSRESLLKSLINSGANEKDAEQVSTLICNDLYNGISTKELYNKAFSLLKDIKSSVAARYSLKRALQKLGPDGFYFEKWVAKVFETQGYQTVTGQTLTGKSSVTHEVDVVAANKEDRLICECKFRNDIEAKISVTIPMYFLARYEDLKNKKFQFFNADFVPTKGFLITNAFFTSDSIAFANYYNINLISWNYPEKQNIKNITDHFGLYPVTCLTSLTDEEEKVLLSKNCILVKDLVQNPVLLDHFKFDDDRKKSILQEANELLLEK